MVSYGRIAKVGTWLPFLVGLFTSKKEV